MNLPDFQKLGNKAFSAISKQAAETGDFVKKKIKQVTDASGLAGEDLGDLPTPSGGSANEVFIFYSVFSADSGFPKNKNDNADGLCMFSLRSNSSRVTLTDILRQFPLHKSGIGHGAGRYHFRFKLEPPSDAAFSDFVWLDVTNPETAVPLFKGNVHMRVLEMPVSRPFSVRDSEKNRDRERASTQPSASKETEGGGHRGARRPSQGAPHPPPPAFTADFSEAPPSSVPPSAGALGEDLLNWDSSPSHQHQQRLSTPPHGSAAGRSHSATPGYHPPSSRPSPTPNAPSSQPSSPFPRTNPPVSPSPDAGLSREELAARREAVKAQRIEEVKQAHEERQRVEAQKLQEKLGAAASLSEEMDRWAKNSDGTFKDVRTLISTLETVLWEGANWKAISIADLTMNESEVKKAYRKAVLMCHPDKHQNSAGDVQLRSERIFQALNEAFKEQK
uniref:J domain-containing protein n=1 Tax=Chromera velia CCMP2878 TaxID=1169474 RepID=A0A0G4HLX5_9ALVE|mmetsp:Transcript_43980/g.86814  ORF Transcript_43980/g.86814 Transcript_43980/m.86814 type:complete len:447 (+) Transcript_43980:136-1476(+)|eukprot:Cvel_7400.t1-p1 / transcript=Cvel_7400.t1 / gene=Cvel_7400 / organism=Chromera_velia_CCMP2878 / gene_product=Auxilin-related protein 2, putative / transcript_product=Auxilin-related protein 2, putative / location=Cvel_scaffold386:22545-26468(+) / protein_length=446 / sequence_SO=supercontig / SO=protein_coding / is_pseudo=false